MITNHHKLALMDLDEELSGLFRHCIIDEANHFEQAVRNAFSLSVHSREIGDAASYLELTLQRALPKASGEVRAALEHGLKAIQEFHQAVREFGNTLWALHPSFTRGEILELPVGQEAYPEGDVGRMLHRFADLLKSIVQAASFLNDPENAAALKIPSRSRERIGNALARLASEGENFLLLEKAVRSENTVASCVLHHPHWILLSSTVDVSGLIKSHVYGKRDGIVYTSATLRHQNRFDEFCRIVGIAAGEGEVGISAGGSDGRTLDFELEEREFRFAAIPSPFSRDALEVVLPDCTENGGFENKKRWLKTVGDQLPELIRRNRGRTLVLFASYRDLEAVASQVGEEIIADGFPLLIQQAGHPTGNLIDEFRLIKESVLFGVDTFWYGVDFQGDTLTQVIITRVPFPYPFDPLQIARKRILPPREFWNRYYYEATIKLKQGIGRLIRSETDRGRVVFLDSRCRQFEELWN